MSINCNLVCGAVIPNHNYSKWIGGAINSIVADPYPYKQLVVVDDGSTDDSWETICSLLSIKGRGDEVVHSGVVKDVPALAYRFTKAGGPSRARNQGIKLLRDHTDIFAFLDADDEYLPGKISSGMSKFAEDPFNVGAVYTDFITENVTTGTSVVEYKEPFDRARLMQECIVNNNSLVNKLALDRCGFYDEEMRTCEDFDLWMRISEHFIILHMPDILVKIRVGGHNSTATVAKEVWNKNWQRVMLKAQSRATK